MTDILKSENNVPMLKKDIGTSLLPTYTDVVSIVDSSGKAAISSDAVGKVRVSMPQSLIDTDFEYGPQSTKWETLSIVSNRQSCFYDNLASINVTAISGAGTRLVTVSTTTPPAVGSVVFIQNTTDTNANGWFYVNSVSAGVNFTYHALANVTGAIFDSTKTYIFQGQFYSQCGIPLSSANAFTYVGNTITCTTTSDHGLVAGNQIFVISTTATTNPPNGAWVVASTPTANTFTFVTVNTPTGTISNVANNNTLYIRPASSVESRPYDGGVQFNSNSLSTGSEIIRQTRRYFRYQSGKGIQFSTGTIFCPALYVTSIASVSNVVTVTTRFPHSVDVGTKVRVNSIDQAGFSGYFTVTSAPTSRTFTYFAPGSGTQTATSQVPFKVTPINWNGSSIKIGIFDRQNGLFFEYDGQKLYVVRRSSVHQMNGTVSVTNGSQIVTGVGTQFLSQLKAGDYIVIRGNSYYVLQINSDTSLIVSSQYKGVGSSNVIYSKTIETKVEQKDWNDPCDGTGPSGYSIDISRIQMLYVDYSWYGAGYARFGIRGTDGEIFYIHTLTHNNSQYEAYMRSGNLPAHYEVSSVVKPVYLTSTLSNVETTAINVTSTDEFPSSGVICVKGNGATAGIEYIAYTGKTNTTFTGLSRIQAGGNAVAQTFAFSASAPVSIFLPKSQCSPCAAHWGSSVIMDGRFDDDKSLVFNTGMTSALNIANGVQAPIMSIRLAPSVDSGFSGILGAREIINRMQLALESIGILATGPFLIQARLNGRSSGGTFVNVGGASLAQICVHTAGQTITGGENAAAFYTNSSGSSQVLTYLDMSGVRDLGNSILGGGTDNNVPTTFSNVYPDGPDILTITATNIGTGSQSILARLSWKEAQA